MSDTLQKRALLVIDVQNEYVSGKLPIEYPPLAISLANIERAIRTARTQGIPVVVVQQMAPASSPIFAEGSHGGELHPLVAAIEPELLIRKTLPSALAGTGLGEWLRGCGIDTLVVTGFMSQNCIESTIRQAAHEGWQVEYLHDAAGAVSYRNAMGTLPAQQMHEASAIVMQSRFAAVMPTREWIDLVQGSGSARRETILQSRQNAHREDIPA